MSEPVSRPLNRQYVAKPMALPMKELVQILAGRPNPDGKASRYADLQTQTAGRLLTRLRYAEAQGLT
jgi:hypothetical protein